MAWSTLAGGGGRKAEHEVGQTVGGQAWLHRGRCMTCDVLQAGQLCAYATYVKSMYVCMSNMYVCTM